MSYPEMLMYGQCLKRKSNAEDTAVNLAAAAASYGGYAVLMPINIKRFLFMVTTTVTSGLTAAQVQLLSRPTYGSSSGAVTLATLTIPTATAVGVVLYKDISDSTRVQAGYELQIQAPSVQAVDGGTAAGTGWVGFLWEPSPDADAAEANLLKSV